MFLVKQYYTEYVNGNNKLYCASSSLCIWKFELASAPKVI